MLDPLHQAEINQAKINGYSSAHSDVMDAIMETDTISHKACIALVTKIAEKRKLYFEKD